MGGKFSAGCHWNNVVVLGCGGVYVLSYLKVIVSNHVIEVYEMERQPYNQFEIKDKDNIDIFDTKMFALNPATREQAVREMREQIERDLEQKERDKKDRKEERRGQTVRDNRNKVRRLILSNFSNEAKFVTLTFKDNVTDLQTANKEFKKFIQRMRSRFGNFKYISVIEFQKRGAVHYHFIADLPYIENSLLHAIWQNRKITRSKKSKFYCLGDGYEIRRSYDGQKEIILAKPVETLQGFVKINKIAHVDNVGAYVTKYMTKDNDDDRLKGEQMYLCSRGLEQPKSYTGADAQAIIDFYLEQKKEVFTTEYSNEYLGQITYKEYNLNR